MVEVVIVFIKIAEALKVREKAKLFTSLKGSKYILLKGAVKLSNKQKEKLNQVKEASPLVGIMRSLKEEFHYLFENSKNLGEGILKLINWIEKAEPYYRNSVPTIQRWFGIFLKNICNICHRWVGSISILRVIIFGI
ncbi:transposase [Kamptonema animale CS-326]|nr:transposase [Kamptonema animale]MDB9509939.1 transposase [Kamptonema animale CS-326]